MESHLLQMRGLKLPFGLFKAYVSLVASFTDAWIETSGLKNTALTLCRIFYRCVD